MDVWKDFSVEEFQLRRRQYLNADGELQTPLPAAISDQASLISLYRAMVSTRAFDAKAVSLQRTGRLGTFASSLGQEAVSVGTASAMGEKDILLPSYRETGALLLRGVRPVELLLYWGGDERGSNFGLARRDFPISVPVGSQAAHAAGVAYAFQLRNQSNVAVCMMGDGATSKGDVYEALNFAGIWKLPVVFVISNNQWAISVPVNKQTSTTTLAQKAISAGIYSEQIDGNDVIAVWASVEDAISMARRGKGASFIEAVTYRLSDHTTADDSSRYRSDEDVSQHWKLEPISRLRNYLVRNNLWGKQMEEDLANEVRIEVEASVAKFLEFGAPRPESMFDHLYETLPTCYEKYRAMLEEDSGE